MSLTQPLPDEVPGRAVERGREKKTGGTRVEQASEVRARLALAGVAPERVDDDDGLAEASRLVLIAALATGAGTRGTRTEKMVPRPSVLRTVSGASSSCAMRSAIDSPRPRPRRSFPPICQKRLSGNSDPACIGFCQCRPLDR